MSEKELVVANYDAKKVSEMLRGLAFFKTLAEKSRIDVPGYSYAGAPTSVTWGDNFSYQLFKKWVKAEHDFQLAAYRKACEKGPKTKAEWVKSRAKARTAFYSTCQQAQAEIKGTNDQLAKAYQFAVRATATVQLAAESFLTIAPFFAAAPATLAVAGGRLVFYVGSGLAISAAESWSQAENADLAVTNDFDAVTPIRVGYLGGTDDANAFHTALVNQSKANTNQLQAFLKNETYVMENAARRMKGLPIKPRAHWKIVARGGNPAKVYADSSRMIRQTNGALKTVSENAPKQSRIHTAGGKVVKGACILLAIKAEVDSINKFRRHWNGKM